MKLSQKTGENRPKDCSQLTYCVISLFVVYQALPYESVGKGVLSSSYEFKGAIVIHNRTQDSTGKNFSDKLKEDMEAKSMDSTDLDGDEDLDKEAQAAALEEERMELDRLEKMAAAGTLEEAEDDFNLDDIENILTLPEAQYPKFTLAKNKARFLRMVSWYRGKEEWIEVAPLSGVTKLFKQQTKELETIRSHKLDYEMELETGTLTPSQRSYRRDELKMCRVQEKMAVHLISKLQIKIKSGRR